MAKKGTTKYDSSLMEKSVARDVSGRTVISSGSLWHSKGDVRNTMFLFECKTTSNDRYKFSNLVWGKIKKEATKDGVRIPVLVVDLYGGKYRQAVLEYNQFFGFFTEDIGMYVIKELIMDSVSGYKFSPYITHGFSLFYPTSSTFDSNELMVSVPWNLFKFVIDNVKDD